MTSKQIMIIAAAIIGDRLEFFDYYLIGFVLAFFIRPWQLSGYASAAILLPSGARAILDASI